MGFIIVVEGTDGSGKQTQTLRLVDRLQAEGYNVIRQSFPNYDSPSSSPVKMYLNGEFGSTDQSLDAYQASILYACDRVCTYNKDLKAFYENGGVIVFDRYVEANILHQTAKIKDFAEKDKFLEWLDSLEFGYMKLPRANKVIFLDVPVEVSQALANARTELKTNGTKDIHEQDKDHLRNAYENGMYVGRKYGWNMIECTRDGKMKSIEEISDMIYGTIIEDLRKNVEPMNSDASEMI